MPRRFPIFQFPNRPLITASVARLTAVLAGRGHLGEDGRRLSPLAVIVSHLALIVWALEELVSGANWLRRLLGLAGGGYALSRLFQSWAELLG